MLTVSSVRQEVEVGDNLRKALGRDCDRRGAISFHVPDSLGLDHAGRSRSARSENHVPAKCSPLLAAEPEAVAKCNLKVLHRRGNKAKAEVAAVPVMTAAT